MNRNVTKYTLEYCVQSKMFVMIGEAETGDALKKKVSLLWDRDSGFKGQHAWPAKGDPLVQHDRRTD